MGNHYTLISIGGDGFVECHLRSVPGDIYWLEVVAAGSMCARTPRRHSTSALHLCRHCTLCSSGEVYTLRRLDAETRTFPTITKTAYDNAACENGF